ncbi:RES family NAD+ phosphorylase [Shivajiella indica]|uniref:RES family NAD+ phosphorylase n=1 Tax=Shivajiella indica TaxID=872115 RepID=A0ABW5B9F7_9BACT
MFVYRLTRSKYAEDLSGFGAALSGGRWNKKGRAVLYCSESPALSLLEIVVNIPPMFQPDLKLLTIKIPDQKIFVLEKEKLPANWYHYPAPRILAEIAEEYYQKQEIIGIKVPSAVLHQQSNILINPKSNYFDEVKVLSNEPFIFDPRLYRRIH